MRCLLNLDFYGVKPSLKINKQKSYKTVFGTVISLLIIILSLSVGIYFGISIFLKDKSSIIFSVINSMKPPVLNISSKNFAFAIAMENLDYNYYIDESIYKISGSIVNSKLINETWQTETTNLNFSRCEVDNFPEIYKPLLNVKSLNNMYCLDKETNYVFNGTFQAGYYTEVFIYLSQCTNKTNSNCKSQEEIDLALNGAVLEIMHTESSIDPSNFTRPNQILFGDLFTVVSNKYLTNIHQTFKNVIIQSDTGILIQQLSEEKLIQSDKTQITNIFSNSLDYYVCFMVELSSEIDIYKRTYSKVQDVAAQIGGVANFLFISGKILTFLITNRLYQAYLANYMFEFSSKFEKKFKKNDLNKKYSNIQSNNFFDLTHDNISMKKDIKSSLIKEKFGLKLKEIIVIFFCGFFKKFKNKKFNFLDKIGELVESKLNVENFIDHFHQFDKLKRIFFDEDQLTVFEKIRRQNINLKTYAFPFEQINKKIFENSLEILRNRAVNSNSIDFKIMNLTMNSEF